MVARIGWRRSRIGRRRKLAHSTSRPSQSAPIDDREQQGQHDQTAHADADANHDVLVLVDPAQRRRALALACLAVAAGFARRAVEVILVHFDASGCAEGMGQLVRAADKTARRGVGVVARPGVVAVQQCSHHVSALVVAAGALAAGAGEPCA